jgi:CubicO group peptidase (beta-lactamase class C family)
MEHLPTKQVISGRSASEFDRIVTAWEAYGFSGGLFLLDRGKPVLRRAYGYGRWPERVKNTADTLFPIASVTKQFTAAAILKLELEGKLLTSDPVRRYLGPFPGELGITTIHHLLTHTSGLIRRDTTFESSNSSEFVEKLKKAPRESYPGEKHRYANGGYSLLAAIIETVTGGTFQRYLREHLFLPAGMQQTRFIDEVNFEDLKVARGHYIWESQVQAALKSVPPVDAPEELLTEDPRPSGAVSCDWSIITSGGVVTTLYDIEAWECELAAGRVLSADAVNRFFAPYVRDSGSDSAYQSYAWTVGQTPGGVPFAGIYGDYQGYQSAYMRYAGGELAMFLAANTALEQGGPGGWRLPVRSLFEDLFL